MSSLGRALVSLIHDRTYLRKNRIVQTLYEISLFLPLLSPLPLCLSLFLRKKETKFSHEWINRVTIMADLSSRPIKFPDPRFSNVASHRAFRCSRRNCERRPFRVISQSWCVPLQLGNVCATQRSNGAARVT